MKYLGGIAALITALFGVYKFFIENKEDNSQRANSEIKYKCTVEDRKLDIDKNYKILSSHGWKINHPGAHPKCEFDIVPPDGGAYCVTRSNDVLMGLGNPDYPPEKVGNCDHVS